MIADLRTSEAVPIEALDVEAYKIPTDAPESDGTLEWDATTLVVVHLRAGGERGIGYTYADAATARVVADDLREVVVGGDALSPPSLWDAMVARVRNLGYCGITAMAISAVDCALWDLKAKLHGVPLAVLLGMRRRRVPIYGSGGFTSYSPARLQEQLAGWIAMGIPRVKMKIGRDPRADASRVGAARDAIGPEAELFVDANGAYARKPALEHAARFAALGVSWYEEPVNHLDHEGLRLVRDRAPAEMEISAGEYGYDLRDFARLVDAGAVDVLQADVSRCGGVTGFARVDALCAARDVPLSTHCAPLLSLHAACAAKKLRHMEWFHDHVRIERMLFDGVPSAVGGRIEPDLTRPGIGFELKRADAAAYAV